MPFTTKDVLMRRLMSCRRTKKDFIDRQVSEGKCNKLLNGPREIYEEKKKAKD